MDNQVTCNVCSDTKNKLLMKCERCLKDSCTKCLGMKKPVFEALNSISNSHWFCDSCNDPAMSLIKHDSTIKQACERYLQSFTQRIESIEDMILHKASADDVAQLQERIQLLSDKVDQQLEKSKRLDEIEAKVNSEVVSKPPAANEEHQPGSIEAVDCLQDRINRKNNVVLFNVSETVGNTKEDAIANNKSEIKKIAEEIDVHLKDEDILSFRRIGKTNLTRIVDGEEIKVPRILLVTLSEHSKVLVMRNANKLRFSSSKYMQNIRIKHDMSKDDRQKEYELRKEAKEKQSESKNEDFLYVVRGPNWDRKIVRIRQTKPKAVEKPEETPNNPPDQ